MLRKPFFLFLPLWLLLQLTASGQTYSWQSLANAPTSGGKQDDVYFINPDTGFCVNGLGRIFRTVNRGQTFSQLLQKTGTYFRAIVALDARHLFAGNIGTNYFPNVSDTTVLYRSDDAGTTWSHVPYSGPRLSGICAFSMVQTPFINAGILDTQTTIVAGGRVGGPAHLLRSDDGGQTWTSRSLASQIGMITDVHFFHPDSGFVFGGSSSNIAVSRAKIIFTADGGQTWTTVYQSDRNYETIWKGHFPSRSVGYATVLSYNTGNNTRYVAKTVDGGQSWADKQVSTNGAQFFGIGFITDSLGWIGSNGTGFKTTNGGATWTSGGLTQACNKIRILRRGSEVFGYGIGVGISRLRVVPVTEVEELRLSSGNLRVYPNPSQAQEAMISFPEDFGSVQSLDILDFMGRKVPVRYRIDGQEIHLDDNVAAGQYLARIRFSAAGMQQIRFQVQNGKP